MEKGAKILTFRQIVEQLLEFAVSNVIRGKTKKIRKKSLTLCRYGNRLQKDVGWRVGQPDEKLEAQGFEEKADNFEDFALNC